MTLNLIVDENGLTVPTYQEILIAYQNEFKKIYGSDINLSSSSPDGQQLGIWAGGALDLATFAKFLSTQIDPDESKTRYLERICKLSAMHRVLGTSSVCKANVVANSIYYLKAPYQVKDINENIWETRTNYDLVIGDNEVLLFSADLGDVTKGIDIGDINDPQTVIPEIDSVTNTVRPSAGLTEETDKQMRERRIRSLETPAFSVTASLLGKVLQLDGVRNGNVYENCSDFTDVEKNMPAHSIWVIVDADKNDNDFENRLAHLIAVNKTAGTVMKGKKNKALIFNVPNPNGKPVEVPMTVAWDYPTAKEFKVYVKVKNLIEPVDPDYTPLKEAIADTKQNLGENIFASAFYQPALSINSPSWIVQTIEIEKKAGGGRTLEIESYFDELWSCSVDDVVIEEVT